MPRVTARGLAWLVLALVVAGCTTGRGGKLSRWEQKEIDHVLNSAFAGNLSHLEAFLDDEVTLGFSDGEAVPVPRNMVIPILQAYIGGSLNPPGPSPSPRPEPEVNLAFERKSTFPMEQGRVSVQGSLYIAGIRHDAEIQLRRHPGGGWKISRLKILPTQLLDPIGNASLVGWWQGEWWSDTRHGRGDVSVRITTCDGYLCGQVSVDGHDSCSGWDSIHADESGIRPTWWSLDLRFHFWADGFPTNNRLTGWYLFCNDDTGRFELKR